LPAAGASSLTYDAAGNVTTTGSSSFSWDWAGRLASATVGGTTSTYTYDGDNTRVAATSGGSTTNYVWDRASSLPLLIDDGTQGYVQTDEGLLEQLGSAASFTLSDALGSVRSVVSPTASAVGTASYDAFGSVRSQTGQASIFGFTGQQTDSTGLSYLRARYYNPSTGSFLSPDRVQPNAPGTQGFNTYSYVTNNPASVIDRTGNGDFEEVSVIDAQVARAVAAMRAFAQVLADAAENRMIALYLAGRTLVAGATLATTNAAPYTAAAVLGLAAIEAAATVADCYAWGCGPTVRPPARPKPAPIQAPAPTPDPTAVTNGPRIGQIVYRVFDSVRSSWDRPSWTPDDPELYGPQKYRVVAGLPDQLSTGNCLVKGVLTTAAVPTKPSDPMWPPESYRYYRGGLTEYVLTNPRAQVALPTVSKLDPPYGGNPDNPPRYTAPCILTA
jgi:RHS repeat-associated protein